MILPTMCNGLMVPIVVVDQMYSLGRDSLKKAIPRPEDIPEEEFEEGADDLLSRIMQMADNVGATDGHRTLNYLVVRYDRIYDKTARQFVNDFALTSIDTLSSRLSGVRKVVDVVFRYTHQEIFLTESWFVRVDVPEGFSFLVTGLSPYFDR